MINGPGKQAIKKAALRVTILSRRWPPGGTWPMAGIRRTAGPAVKALAEQINELDGIEIYGRVVGVRGLMVEVFGPAARDVGRRPGGDRDARQEHSLRGGRLLRQ